MKRDHSSSPELLHLESAHGTSLCGATTSSNECAEYIQRCISSSSARLSLSSINLSLFALALTATLRTFSLALPVLPLFPLLNSDHHSLPPLYTQNMAPSATVLSSESPTNTLSGALGKTTTGKPLKIRSYPHFTNPLDERLYRQQHLAAAYRVFAARGFDEGVAGHISVRDPLLPDHFWLNPLSTHFSLIRVSDLILVNEAGEVVIGTEPINAAAFAIHAEIHKARPDVHAACHAHSVYGKAWSVFGKELDMITQDSLRFYGSHSVYPQFGGVVLDREEGRRIAACLGDGKAVILQNHGLLTVCALHICSYDSGMRLRRDADGLKRLARQSMRRRSGSFRWIRRVRRSYWSTRRRQGIRD